MNTEDMAYFYRPSCENDFIRIAEDVYGASIRDNSREDKILLGVEYHGGDHNEP